LGLGVGLVIGLDKIDPRFKTAEEIEGYLNLPALGVIPEIISNTEKKKRFRRKTSKNKVAVS